jgi:hypothetical protein
VVRVPVPVVVVTVPVVGDGGVVPVDEAAGEEVGEAPPVRSWDADGVGLASGPDEVGDVAVELDPGTPPEGDGDTSLLPPMFVSVVPDVDELPRGWPIASSERLTTAIAATNSRPATAATGPQRSLVHHCVATGPASGSRGTAGGTAAGSCAEASSGPVPPERGRVEGGPDARHHGAQGGTDERAGDTQERGRDRGGHCGEGAAGDLGEAQPERLGRFRGAVARRHRRDRDRVRDAGRAVGGRPRRDRVRDRGRRRRRR